METSSYSVLLNAYWWDNSVQVAEYGGREVQVYSGNGKLYGLVEAFMERAMRNKSGKSGWDEYLEKITCAKLKSLDFIW